MSKRQKHLDSLTNRQLKFKYNITLKDYNKMWLKQEGCCLCCGRHQSEFARRLHVDHSHKTGKVRGLLCSNCNTILGKLKEDLVVLEKVKQYITGYCV